MDVIPIKGNRWIARCADCGRAIPFDEQPEAWQWLLDHPCATSDWDTRSRTESGR